MTAPTRPVAPRREEQLAAIWLGRILRIGVLTAALFVLIGLALALLGGHGEPATLDAALGRDTPVAQLGPDTILDGLGDGSAPAFIQLGILVLVLTPTVRVAMTVGIFARQHDRTFVLLALIVLVILLLGLVGIGA